MVDGMRAQSNNPVLTQNLRVFLILIFLLLPSFVIGDEPTANRILRNIDEMLLYNSSKSKLKMIIHLPGDVIREKEMAAFTSSRDTSFTEFLAPARDRGTRYLKIKKSMWVFFPRARRTILIKGHMLRQGMMGSDFSYEDILESNSFLNDYDARILGSESWRSTDCYKLELTAKRSGITYHKRIIWVDKKTSIPIHNQLYAVSGKLLKTFDMESIKRFGRRFFPTEWIMKDELRENTKTIMQVLEIEFNVPIKKSVFSKRNLER